VADFMFVPLFFKECADHIAPYFAVISMRRSAMRRPMKTELVSEKGASVVRLEIGDHLAHLSASDVDALIENLGTMRATMVPAVAGHISRQHRYSIEINPSWYAEPHPLPGSVVVFLRDTGLGWTGFRIDRESARSLCNALSGCTDRLETPAGMPN
jgi:hypothetical protein